MDSFFPFDPCSPDCKSGVALQLLVVIARGVRSGKVQMLQQDWDVANAEHSVSPTRWKPHFQAIPQFTERHPENRLEKRSNPDRILAAGKGVWVRAESGF